MLRLSRIAVSRWLWRAGWALTGLLGAIATLRLLWHDGLWLLLLLNNVTRYLYLPAWPIGLAAAFARRWRLAAVAGVLVSLHAHWSLLPLLARTAPPGTGRSLKVVSANLLVVNEEQGALADELERMDADIYFLQELSAQWDEEFERRKFWDRYPYHRRLIGEDAFGCAIASRIPARNLQEFTLTELPQMSGLLEFEGREIALFDVHLLPPRNAAYYAYYRLGADALLDLVRHLEGRSFIIAGDFNATPDSDLADRMRGVADDAWESAGRGFGFTWPNGQFPLPSLRIDHVFVSRDLAVRRVAVGVGAGSDHRPVAAEIMRRKW